MINKLILGTVQFGIPYGINNTIGMITDDQVLTILKKAKKLGIQKLDTAAAYGLAEKRIGLYHQNNLPFDIITKFSKDNNINLFSSLQQSIETLHLEKVETIMFHSFESYLLHLNDIDLIIQNNKNISFKYLGVSVYTNQELEILLEDPNVNIVQVPFNMLDNHQKRSDIFQKLKNNGKIIHTRSCFLQGLFFMDVTQLDEKFSNLKKYLFEIKKLALDYKYPMGHIALQYVLQKKYIDGVLIGVDSEEQLIQNILWAEKTIPKELSELIDEINVEDLEMLNPAKW